MGRGQVSSIECNRRWRDNNQEMCRDNAKKYRSKRENRDKINEKVRKNRQYMKKGAACEIIKEHDIRHRDDPESLDIRKMMDIDCGVWVLVKVNDTPAWKEGEHD